MCVQNDVLTIAGEVRAQNGTHPNPLPKTLTGPNLKRFGLVQTCRGMRGFTDFCLCSIRAKFAPVSAHLSICRNFTTALPGARHSVATGRRGIERTGSQRPVCMYRRGCLGDRDRAPHPETGTEKRVRNVDRNRFTGPGAHCTAHRIRSVPKILTLSARNSVTSISTNPRPTRDQQFKAPEKPHLDDKNDVPTNAEAAPEKSHRNRRGIKNVNDIRYLCAPGVPLCPAIIPRKASPLRRSGGCGSCVLPPEKSHLCQKVAQRKSDFRQSRWAFQRIRCTPDPGNPHLSPIFEQMALLKKLTCEAPGSL